MAVAGQEWAAARVGSVRGTAEAESQRPLVLVVDDDRTLRRLCESALVADYRVITASNGEEALRQVYEHHPQLILLDVSMPVMDGWEACRRIRQVCDTPVIMLTARDSNDDVVKGLDAGADDYVTKPFHPGQLRARIRAVLRRNRTVAASPDVVSLAGGSLVVDRLRRLAIVEGREVMLTSTEYKLLEYLALRPDEVVPTRRLLEHAWGPEYIGEVDYVKTYIAHLRRKIERDPRNPEYFHARRGMGYVLSSSGRQERAEESEETETASDAG